MQSADRTAAAAALRAGRPDPGDPGIVALEARLSAIIRDQDVVGVAYRAVAGELGQLVAEHRDEWAAETEAAIAAAREAAREKFAIFRRARQRLAELEGVDGWLRTPDQRPSAILPRVGGLDTSSMGEHHPLGRVQDAIEDGLAEPVERLPGVWRDGSAPEVERAPDGGLRRPARRPAPVLTHVVSRTND